MRHWLWFSVCTVALSCVVVTAPAAATSAVSPGGGAGIKAPTLNWAACDDSGDGYECAAALVPLDYRDPFGKQFTLSVIRKPATDPANRIGSLFTSPGGPGLDAFLMVRDFGDNAPPVLRERYDIIGFDPRGVGGSSRLNCVTQPVYSDQWARSTGRPSAGGFERAVAFGKQFNDGCTASDAELLPYLGTGYVARDMDLLRAAVGDEKLNFFGFSYGTYIGAVYANLFPKRIRVLALDGAVDADGWTNDPYKNNHAQYVAGDIALKRFFAWCVKSPGQCEFGAGRPAEAFLKLQADLDANPIRNADGRVIATGALLTLRVAMDLGGGRAGWPELARQLHEVATTRGGFIVREVSAGFTRYMVANTAIECADRQFPRDLETLRVALSEAVAAAPYLGPGVAYGPPNYDQGHAQACAQWPVERRSNYSGPWNAPGAAPALVVGTTHDPDVPFQEAVTLSKTLENARLLTFRGESHTAWFSSECSKAIITKYLIDATLPPPNAYCDDEPVPTEG